MNMAKKKKRSIAKKLEYKIASKSRRERRILTVAMWVIGAVAVAVIAGIIIYNVIEAGKADSENKEYTDYITEDKEELKQNERVVATCNGFEVPYEALRFHTVLQKKLMEAEYGEGIWDKASTAEPLRAELEEAVIKSLQADYMILSACRKLGVDTEQGEIVQLVNQKMAALWEQTELDFEAQTGDAKTYDSVEAMFVANLDDLGMSENQLRMYYKVQDCLPQLIFYAMEEYGHFSYVLSNLQDFSAYVFEESDGEPNFMRTIQVITEDEATAQRIYEALSLIADPDERLTRMNAYIGSKDNKDTNTPTKDGYYFARGEMQEVYEETAAALEYGEVSRPVEIAGQWCVMMRLELDEDYVTTNIATLLQGYQNTVMDRYVESFRENCTVKYTAYGVELDLVAIH